MTIDFRLAVSCPVCQGIMPSEANANSLCTYHRLDWLKSNNKQPVTAFRTG